MEQKKSEEVPNSQMRRRPNPVSEPQLPQIPNELISEILIRLPAKSLVRFRCVSKSWLALISNPNFIKTHLIKSSNDEEYTHHKIIFQIRHELPDGRKVFYFKQSPLCPALSAPITKTSNIDRYYGGRSQPGNRIVGSSNGLICVDAFGDILLCNPSIQKSKKLPDFVSGLDVDHISYSFGYDESNDDYKVFQIRQNGSCTHGETWFDVYSLNADSWKTIDDSNGDEEGVCFHGGGKLHWKLFGDRNTIFLDEGVYFVSGKLHWTTCANCGSVGKIVSLDLENGKYGEVKQPEYEEGNLCKLGVLGGCLSVFCYYRKGDDLNWDSDVDDQSSDSENGHLDLWIMKEYGVIESWTKVVLLPFLYDPFHVLHCIPVFLTKDGKILFKFGAHLELFNPKHDLLTSITNFEALLQVIVHVESLVLLNDHGGDERPGS